MRAVALRCRFEIRRVAWVLKGTVGGKDGKLSTAWMVRFCASIRNERSMGCWLEMITQDRYACRGCEGRSDRTVASCGGRGGGEGERGVSGSTDVCEVVEITSAEIAA